MNEILRYYPYLRVCNKNKITDRVQRATDGDMFVAFNKLKGVYELHSIKSFRINRHSIQGRIDIENLNHEIIKRLGAGNLEKYEFEMRDHREYLTQLHDNAEEKHKAFTQDKGRKLFKTSLGRDL